MALCQAVGMRDSKQETVLITFLLILCELINTFNWLPINRTYEKLRKTNQILNEEESIAIGRK